MAFCRVTSIWKRGRQLASLTQDGTTWHFTYNADGIRTKRTTCAACTGSTTCEACGEGTSNATTYSYVYNGSSLSQMTVGNHQLNFLYDANGAPMVVIYNGEVYYYVTNLQGDVIAILDSDGNAVVEYSYDAWGKLLATSDSTETGLATKNPLRYRGYVYDPESALYYLQSRYYDPELGRFINADAFASTGQGILGNNMFAYCLNNPVCSSDHFGYAAIHNQMYVESRVSSGRNYITDQNDPKISNKRFGLATVGHGGCGAIASYNALITLGASRSFDDVLAFYNRRMPATLGWGFTGLMPRDIANYFTSLGYTVLITDQTSQIDAYSQSASACIMYYKFPRTYQVFNSLSIDAYGAHFIEYSRLSNGYVGRNTSEGSGTYAFSSPYGYGTKGPRYYVVGVFIYK